MPQYTQLSHSIAAYLLFPSPIRFHTTFTTIPCTNWCSIIHIWDPMPCATHVAAPLTNFWNISPPLFISMQWTQSFMLPSWNTTPFYPPYFASLLHFHPWTIAHHKFTLLAVHFPHCLIWFSRVFGAYIYMFTPLGKGFTLSYSPFITEIRPYSP